MAMDEVQFLLQASKADAQGWEALISSGKLQLPLLLSCLLHPSCSTALSPPHLTTLWTGILRSTERSLEAAPCGYLIAAALAQAVVHAARTGTCPTYMPAIKAPGTGSDGAPATWTLQQVWAAYEVSWQYTLAQELAAQYPGDAEPASAAQPDTSSTFPTPSPDQIEAACNGIELEERSGLTALRELVASLDKTARNPLPAAVRLSKVTDVVHLQLQGAVVAARAVKRAVGECVAREEILLTGRAGVGAGGAAAAKAKKKKRKSKKTGRAEEEKAAEVPKQAAAVTAPLSSLATAAATAAATVQPAVSRRHALSAHVVVVSSRAEAALAGRALPCDALYNSLLSSWSAYEAVEERGPDCAQAVLALASSWAEYASSALTDEGLSRAIAVPAHVQEGSVLPQDVTSGNAGAAASTPTVPALVCTVVRGAALAGGALGIGVGVSVRAAHVAAAARLLVAQDMLHCMGCASAGLAEEVERTNSVWVPSLPSAAVESAARLLAAGQGIRLSGPVLPMIDSADEIGLKDDVVVASGLTPAEEAWVEEAADSLAPRIAPRPAAAAVAAAYAAVGCARAASLCCAGDAPAARRVHEGVYWWMAEHVVLPAHTAGGGAQMDVEEVMGSTATPSMSVAHTDACATALHTWASFERTHGACAEDEDHPLFHAHDLRRRAGADAARNVLLAYAEASRAGAVALVRAARHAHLCAQVSRQRVASAAQAAAKEAVALAVQERRRQQEEEDARRNAAVAAAIAAAAVAPGTKTKKKFKSASDSAKSKVAPAAPTPPPPPPPPSLASIKASAKGGEGGAAAAKDAGKGIEARLDLSAVLAHVQTAAIEAGRLGCLPLPPPPPIPDSDAPEAN